jgi:hypothetical protein
MNKKQQELLDEAYEDYFNVFEKEWIKQYDPILGDFNHEGRPITKEEFINKCKTDTEFSEKWGLKIEERELSDDERYNLLSDTEKRSFIVAIIPGVEYGEEVKYTLDTFYKHVPTKLITITYNNQKIESYE